MPHRRSTLAALQRTCCTQQPPPFTLRINLNGRRSLAAVHCITHRQEARTPTATNCARRCRRFFTPSVHHIVNPNLRTASAIQIYRARASLLTSQWITEMIPMEMADSMINSNYE